MVLWIICLECPPTMIVLNSASWVAKILGLTHHCHSTLVFDTGSCYVAKGPTKHTMYLIYLNLVVLLLQLPDCGADMPLVHISFCQSPDIVLSLTLNSTQFLMSLDGTLDWTWPHTDYVNIIPLEPWTWSDFQWCYICDILICFHGLPGNVLMNTWNT
jgi:hypothetical protein